jgi:biotin carboxyl carrier protein
VESEGKNEIDTRKRIKMKKKFKVKVDGKEYVVEVEGMEEVGGGRGESNSKAEKKTGMKEKEPYGKFESITTGEKSLFAPMPAKAIKVNCKAGESVRKGEILIILEAMKMENEIRSPVDGVIKEVMVEEGANVSHNEKMIVFE